MQKKFIKILAILIIFIFFFSLTSCNVINKAKSKVKTGRSRETIKTSSEASAENDLISLPKDYVNDDANIFTEEDIAKMNQLIGDLEKQTTAEIGVATIKSLNNRTIEKYANDLFNFWGIGKKDVNNGILFLIAMKEHQCRIEVGYGLENVITDNIARDIIEEIAIPYFQENNYAVGTYEAVKKISEHIIAASKQ